MNLQTIVGKNVKYYRYKKGLTQESLAELVNASPNYIGRLERGQHNPSLKKIEDIANGLDIEAFQLFISQTAKEHLPDRINLTRK